MSHLRAPILMLVAIVAAVACGTAAAAYDPVGAGAVRLAFDRSFQRVLGRGGIELKARGGGEVTSANSGFALPALGGHFDPTLRKGTIETGGEILLMRGSKRVSVKDVMLKSKQTPLFARIGGGQQRVASAARVLIQTHGFGAVFVASGLRLSRKTATRLNKRLDVDGFAPGQLIGFLRAGVSPSTISILPEGDVLLTPAPSFQAKLKSLFVAVNPIFPAEANGGSFQLPVEGRSTLSQAASEGTLRTGGSLEFLQLGGGQVFWHEAWFDIGAGVGTSEADIEPSPPYPGKEGRTATVDLDAATAARSADPRARTISLSGAPVRLDAAMASDFNRAFARGQSIFGADETIGTLSFSVTAQ